MDAIVAAYGSPSSSSSEEAGAASSSDEAESAITCMRTPVGAKRRRSGSSEPQEKPQWTRAFPHVEGNWPSHVRVDIAVTEELRSLVTALISRAQEAVGDAVALVPLEAVKKPAADEEDTRELHLSLSRPFVLTHGQIDAFVDALRAALKWRKRFRIALRHALVLVNDEKTRSFLALRVVEGEQAFLQTLRCVDACLKRFHQPPYYEEPIPHVSIASSLGEELARRLPPDQCQRLLTARQEGQQATTATTATTAAKSFSAGVAAVHVVIGNKHFDIPLQ